MIEINGFLDSLNPLKHFSQMEYTSVWKVLFNTFLQGFWARLLALVSLVGAFWLGVYRQRFFLGVVLFVVAVTITYLGGPLKVMFWWGF